MKIFSAMLLLSSTLLALGGCGGSGGSSSSCTGETVQYSLDCETGPVCINASSIDGNESGKSKQITCVWWCATYEDQIEANVTVNFSKTGSGCWQEDSVRVTGGQTIVSEKGGT